MRYQGRITTWKDDRGFGFITPNGGGNELFLHVNALQNRQRRPVGNELVTYEATFDSQGRAQAISVAFVGEKQPSSDGAKRSGLPPLIAISFLGFVAAAVLTKRLPAVVLGLYVVASLVTFFAYAFDKSAAKRNEWRTKESTLHMFALIGGWPGALAAQRVLRHKSAKSSFQITYWVTVLINCGALIWCLSPTGATVLRSLLGR